MVLSPSILVQPGLHTSCPFVRALEGDPVPGWTPAHTVSSVIVFGIASFALFMFARWLITAPSNRRRWEAFWRLITLHHHAWTPKSYAALALFSLLLVAWGTKNETAHTLLNILHLCENPVTIALAFFLMVTVRKPLRRVMFWIRNNPTESILMVLLALMFARLCAH